MTAIQQLRQCRQQDRIMAAFKITRFNPFGANTQTDREPIPTGI
jgi:hypothetical protein